MEYIYLNLSTPVLYSSSYTQYLYMEYIYLNLSTPVLYSSTHTQYL